MLTTLSSGLVPAIVGLAAVALFIVRQFSTRRVNSPWLILVPLALGYFGISNAIGQLDSTAWILLGINLSLGVAFGVVRGVSLRVWTNEGNQALVRGTRLTLLLWLATIAARIGVSVLERQSGLGAGLSTAEMLLPVAATLAAQNLVVFLRSQDVRLATA